MALMTTLGEWVLKPQYKQILMQTVSDHMVHFAASDLGLHCLPKVN